MDIHDISRAAKTYGVKRFYIITPLEQQRQFVRKILHHWQEGYGACYNPWRKKALDITSLKSTLEDAVREIKEESEANVNLVTTGASPRGESSRFEELREKISGKKYQKTKRLISWFLALAGELPMKSLINLTISSNRSGDHQIITIYLSGLPYRLYWTDCSEKDNIANFFRAKGSKMGSGPIHKKINHFDFGGLKQ